MKNLSGLLSSLAASVGLMLVASCGDDPQTLGERGSGGAAGAGGALGGSTHTGGASVSGGASGVGGGGNAATGGSIGGSAGASGGASAGAATGGSSAGSGAQGGSDGHAGASGGGGEMNAGAGGDGAGAGAHGCGDAPCTAPLVCVAYRVVGGARLLPDTNGTCPSGQHVEDSGASASCARDFAYECRTLVGCASDGIACACGAATCPNGYATCRDPNVSTWLEPAASLVCELLAP